MPQRSAAGSETICLPCERGPPTWAILHLEEINDAVDPTLFARCTDSDHYFARVIHASLLASSPAVVSTLPHVWDPAIYFCHANRCASASCCAPNKTDQRQNTRSFRARNSAVTLFIRQSQAKPFSASLILLPRFARFASLGRLIGYVESASGAAIRRNRPPLSPRVT